jgi:hypothetical protein
MILDRRTSSRVARLRPIPGTDRFALFRWSNTKGRWTTFGNLGRRNLMIESAHEIVANDPIFRIPRGRLTRSILAKVELPPLFARKRGGCKEKRGYFTRRTFPCTPSKAPSTSSQ